MPFIIGGPIPPMPPMPLALVGGDEWGWPRVAEAELLGRIWSKPISMFMPMWPGVGPWGIDGEPCIPFMPGFMPIVPAPPIPGACIPPIEAMPPIGPCFGCCIIFCSYKHNVKKKVSIMHVIGAVQTAR
jgi:hypothetical protein